MLGMNGRLPLLLATTLGFAFLAVSSVAGASDLEQHLRDRYLAKTFVLRGFYSDDKLHYDATGTVVGKPRHGDWTADGFVTVSEIHISGTELGIDTNRKIVVASSKTETLQLRDLDTGMFGTKRPISLKIEADLGAGNPSLDVIAAAISRIFLTMEDSFVERIPAYWRPCILADYGGTSSNCHLSKEMLAVPGVGLAANRDSVASAQGEDSSIPPVVRPGKGITAPMPTYHPDPPFSERARQQRIQGTVLLSFVLDSEGHPTRIRIVSPLGCGLDEMAVRGVKAWRFIPARRDGQNIPVELAVEVNFHLY